MAQGSCATLRDALIRWPFCFNIVGRPKRFAPLSENLAAKRLLDLIPAIMQRWDDRVRGEVSQRQGLRKSCFATASLKCLK